MNSFRPTCSECGTGNYGHTGCGIYVCTCGKAVSTPDFELEDGEQITRDEAGYLVIISA